MVLIKQFNNEENKLTFYRQNISIRTQKYNIRLEEKAAVSYINMYFFICIFPVCVHGHYRYARKSKGNFAELHPFLTVYVFLEFNHKDRQTSKTLAGSCSSFRQGVYGWLISCLNIIIRSIY